MTQVTSVRAVVTGAAGGIGRATVLRLNADSHARTGHGGRFLIADIAAEPLEQTAAMVRAAGGEAVTAVADLTDPDVPARLIAQAGEILGGIDALISNAGIIQKGSLLETSVADFDKAFAINTRATWLLAKAAHPYLKEAGGCIVAVASIAAYEPTPALGAYSASKAALLMLIRQLACDWGPDGIRANTVSPGSTRTNIVVNAGMATAVSTATVANNPLQMLCEPEDQAAVIAFLASPDARFITGADIVADGGTRTQLMLVSGLADPRQSKG